MHLLHRYDVLVLALAVAYVFACPFTKVEESFNVQATHDILYHRLDLDRYDHVDFPGVVPRTFLGALMLATITAPIFILQQRLDLPKHTTLYGVRIALACIAVLSMCWFRRALVRRTRDTKFGFVVSVLVASQFHLLFYSSRLLPNTFSLIMCNLAHAAWLSGRVDVATVLFAVNAVVFRSDGVVFAFPQLLWLMCRRRIRLERLIVAGTSATIASVLVSVGVDSFFWKRLVWPELAVFAFNVVDNKSSEWGIHPLHAYVTNFIPKALLAASLFVPFGFVTRLPASIRVWKQAGFRLDLNECAVDVGVPALVSVVLYSLLPHKEIRFLFPALFPLNTVAAMGILSVYRSFRIGTRRLLAAIAIGLALLASFIASLLFVYASTFNYPGGWALHRFHQHLDRGSGTVSVHVDNLAAISGVSRFGQLDDGSVVYNKTEALADHELRGTFDFLIHESVVPGYDLVDSVSGLSRFNWRTMPPSLRLSPQLYILGKRP